MKAILILLALGWAASALGVAIRRAHFSGFCLNDWRRVASDTNENVARRALRLMTARNILIAHVLAVTAFSIAFAAGFLLGRS